MRQSPEAKIAAWYRAYVVVLEEIKDPWMPPLTEYEVGHPPDAMIRAAEYYGRTRRTAAIVAAMLVSSGVRVVPIEAEAEPDT